jgi:hypothetical protein
MRTFTLLINGEQLPGDTTMPVYNPATGAVVTQAQGGAEEPPEPTPASGHCNRLQRSSPRMRASLPRFSPPSTENR